MRRIRVEFGGFTLIEMMMTVVIIGVLAALAAPTFIKSRERAYWRAAEDILLAIYAGERAYFLVNDQYKTVTADSDMAAWRQINIDDPDSADVSYKVAAGVGVGSAATFDATATRTGGPCAGNARTIDEMRDLTAGSCWCAAC